MKLQKFNYNGTDIAFDFGGKNKFINAAQMAKAFGKKPAHWLRTSQATEFIKEYSELQNRNSTDLVKVIRGGNINFQGTWMHEDIALEFARWLSPKETKTNMSTVWTERGRRFIHDLIRCF